MYLKYYFVAIGAFILISSVATAITSNYNVGTVLSLCFSISLVLYGVMYNTLHNKIVLCINLCLIVFLCFNVMLYVYGKSDNADFNEDAIIVLGCGIQGELVPPTLESRLKTAIECYNQNTDAIIVVSGGKGPQEAITEALAMERYLIGKGIPKESIIKEEKATSTFENLKYSKEILDSHFNRDYKSILVTSDFHVFRAMQMANSIGLNCTHAHSSTKWYNIAVNYIRECAAVFYYTIFPNKI